MVMDQTTLEFIENTFRSRLILVSSNNIITIKIEKNVPQENKQTKQIKKIGPSNGQNGKELRL